MRKMYEEHKSEISEKKYSWNRCLSSANNTNDINNSKYTEDGSSKTLRNISLFVLAAALFLFMILTTISPAFALQDLMALQGNAYNGTILINGSVRITVWDQPTDGSLIYDSTNDYDDAVLNGKFDIMLGDGSQELSLEYGKIYYMDMSINGQDLDFNGSERRIFQSNTGGINASYVQNHYWLDINDQRYNDTGYCDARLVSYYNASQINDIFSEYYNKSATDVQIADYVASLNIVNGTNGLNGVNGTNGINGLNGTNGINGINGTSFDVSGIYLYNNGSNVIFFNSTPLQVFNDSLINSTVNIQGLGFNTTNQLKTYFDISYVSFSNIVSYVGNWSAERTGVLINITTINTTAVNANVLATGANNTAMQANTTATQANTTATNLVASNNTIYGRVDMLNSSKLNITDQRYNETASVDWLNHSKASTGNCAVGMIVQNITTSGIECILIPETPADGNNMSVQYNLNGAITGATMTRISPDGYLNIVNASNIPAAPDSGVNLFAQKRGVETVLQYVGPSGLEKTVQPNVGEEDAIWCNPAHSATGTTVHTCTAGYVAAVGTVSNPATSYGTVRDSMAWNVLTSAAGYTEHKALGLKWGRGNASLPGQNGGFKLMLTYYIGGYDANTVGCFGMMDEVSAYTNATNCFFGAANKNSIFVGFNKSQTTLRIFVANATVALPVEVYDCGTNYSISVATNVYRQTIYARPNRGGVSVYVQRVDNASIAPCIYEFTGTEAYLPSSTTPLGWRMFMGRSAAPPGTTGVIFGMNKVYISTDN